MTKSTKRPNLQVNQISSITLACKPQYNIYPFVVYLWHCIFYFKTTLVTFPHWMCRTYLSKCGQWRKSFDVNLGVWYKCMCQFYGRVRRAPIKLYWKTKPSVMKDSFWTTSLLNAQSINTSNDNTTAGNSQTFAITGVFAAYIRWTLMRVGPE